jgi:transcriptional regulator with XRE-family HTH domain
VQEQNIGKAIRQERERAGYSRRAFGFKLDPQHPESARRKIYMWELGEREPNQKNRKAIAEALGLSPSFFNGDEAA